LRTISPLDSRVLFGEKTSHHIIAGILDLSLKGSFSIKELVEQVNMHLLIEEKDAIVLVEKLVNSGLIIPHASGKYTVSNPSQIAIDHFFNPTTQPRRGRKGLMKYLLNPKSPELRIVQWSCIYLLSHVKIARVPSVEFYSVDVSEISGLKADSCSKFLEKLARRGEICRIGRDQSGMKLGMKYSMSQDQELLLYRDLVINYISHLRKIKPPKEEIIELLSCHEKMTFNEIFAHLALQGSPATKDATRKALESLEKGFVIESISSEKSLQGEEYFALNYADLAFFTRDCLMEIVEIFKGLGINVREDFFRIAAREKPHALFNLLQQLKKLETRCDHEVSSWSLWQALSDNLVTSGFVTDVSNFLSVSSTEERDEEMKTLVKKYNISPALLSMLLLLDTVQRKKSARMGDT